MASNKAITAEGKTKMLEYVFAGDEGFNYLALGDSTSGASADGDASSFHEFENGTYGYERVKLDVAENTSETSQSITLSATFDEDNFAPSGGDDVGEIAIVNSDGKGNDSSTDTFFAFADIPNIRKSDNIALKYTIVISIL